MANAAAEQKQGSPQYPALDVIRFLACLLVVLNHLRGNQFLPFSETQCSSALVKRAFFMATRLGVESVVVFFVLSGFLVGGITIDRFLRGTFDPWKYLVDRATRIYTPLVPVVVFCVVMAVWVGVPVTAADVAVNLASLQGAFGDPLPLSLSLWSLAYEVWFYVLCGGVLLMFQSGSKRKWIAFVTIVASAVVLTRLETAYLFAWLFGACAFFLRSRAGAWNFVVGIPLMLGGAAGMQLTSVSTQIDLAGFSWVDRRLAIVALSAGSALVVSVLSTIQATSAFSRRGAEAFQWLSSFSYTLYLIHTPLIIGLFQMGVIRPFGRLTTYSTACFLATALALVAVSWLAALPFEFQTARVRRWCNRRLQ